jgi:hypothetical protein
VPIITSTKRNIIAALYIAAFLPAAPALADAPPRITAGKILTPEIRLSSSPVAPKIELHIHGATTNVEFDWAGPNNGALAQYISAPAARGKTIYQTSYASGFQFPPYTAAGTWTMSAAAICFYSNCNYYSGSDLTALFPSLTLQVVNPKSDITPPSVTAANILTPTVVKSHFTAIQIAFTLGDNLSGVQSIAVEFGSGAKTSFRIFSDTSYPVVKPTSYNFLAYCDCQKLAPGTYPVTYVLIQDDAGNYTQISDAASIAALFNGQPNVTLTQ